MISQIFAIALATQPCPTSIDAVTTDFDASITKKGGRQADILNLEGTNLHCFEVELTRPDGARYIVPTENASDRMRVPLRSDGEMDAKGLRGLPAFFDTSGFYAVDVRLNGAMDEFQKPLYHGKLLWQFPECSLSSYVVEEWMLPLHHYTGPFVKTQRGYEKQIKGDNFEQFDISMSSCTAAGLSIKIKGVKAQAKDNILRQAIAILRHVDASFIDQHSAALRALGEGDSELDISSEGNLTNLYGRGERRGEVFDLELSISLRL